MDSNRRSMRHLESKSDSSRPPTNDPIRASTGDSGRGSMMTSERTPTVDNITDHDASSSSYSRNTPLDDDVHENNDLDKPVRIRRTRVLGKKCYEQAFVSHVDHPSAFFLQLAHFQQQYEELHKEINKFYSKTPITNVLASWKRGDYCIAKYKDNEFYRARIIEVPQVTKTANFYDIVYVDHGNWDKVATSNISPILPKFANLSAQAIPCSLAETLPPYGTWFDHPRTIEFFGQLVFEKYVDATFYLKSSRNFWPLSFVELKLSSSKLNVHDHMKDRNLIHVVTNEKIFQEFSHLLKPADYIIYSIPHEDEENDDDDDE